MTSTDPFWHLIGGVDTFSWNPVREDEPTGRLRSVANFGDLIGPILVERMFDRPKDAMPTRTGAPALMTVGSVIHFAPENAVVWGSGINFKVRHPIPRKAHTLDVRAVRGPLTARTLARVGLDVPEVFGDPALLLPRYLPELATWARLRGDDVTYIPNLNDLGEAEQLAANHRVRVVSPAAPLTHVLRAIASSRFVIGSSLHAVAVADALGIPARFVASPTEHVFKYRDYLAGSGRSTTRIAPDVRTALVLGGHEPMQLDLDALAAAFPRDLWSSRNKPSVPRAFRDHAEIAAAWDRVMAEAVPSLSGETERLTHHEMPKLVELGESMLSSDDASRQQSRIAFDEYFRRVHALRTEIVTELSPDDLNPDLADEVRAVDTGFPEALIRLLWLRRVGPHALLRSTRVAHGRMVLSVALRPGGLSNEISALSIEVSSSDGSLVRREVPVFAQYRRQWSLDLSVGIEPTTAGEVPWIIDVVLTDEAGDVRRLRVDQHDSTVASLLLPSLESTPEPHSPSEQE